METVLTVSSDASGLCLTPVHIGVELAPIGPNHCPDSFYIIVKDKLGATRESVGASLDLDIVIRQPDKPRDSKKRPNMATDRHLWLVSGPINTKQSTYRVCY